MSHYPRITKSIMDEWRQAQGHRGAKGVIEVLRALEFIALPIAEMCARQTEHQPLRLTGKQLRLAQHRALSQRRRAEHGDMPADPDTWWGQIESIAARWGISTARSDWESTTKPDVQEAA